MAKEGTYYAPSTGRYYQVRADGKIRQIPRSVASPDAMGRLNQELGIILDPMLRRLPPVAHRSLAWAARQLWPQNDIETGISLALLAFGGPLEGVLKAGGKAALGRLLATPAGQKLAETAADAAVRAVEHVPIEVLRLSARKLAQRFLPASTELAPIGVAEKIAGSEAQRLLPGGVAQLEGPTIEAGPGGAVRRAAQAFEEGQIVPPSVPFSGRTALSPLTGKPTHPLAAALGRLGARLAVPAAGGVAGALAGGYPVVQGGVTGLAAGLGGELLSLLGGAGRRGIDRVNVARMSQYLQRKFPNVEFPAMNSAADLRNVLKRRLPQAVGKSVALMRSYIGANLDREGIVPAVGEFPTFAKILANPKAAEVMAQYPIDRLDFESIDRIVSGLQEQAHTLAGAQRDTFNARQLNELARGLRSDLENWLNRRMSPDLGGLYRRIRSQYAKATALERIAKRADISEAARLPMHTYQKLATRSTKAEELPGIEELLLYSMGPEELAELQGIMLRGAQPGILDQPGRVFPFRLHTGMNQGLPRFSMAPPVSARHVGKLPTFLGRSGTASYLGSRPGVDVMRELFGEDANAANTTR